MKDKAKNILSSGEGHINVFLIVSMFFTRFIDNTYYFFAITFCIIGMYLLSYYYFKNHKGRFLLNIFLIVSIFFTRFIDNTYSSFTITFCIIGMYLSSYYCFKDYEDEKVRIDKAFTEIRDDISIISHSIVSNSSNDSDYISKIDDKYVEANKDFYKIAFKKAQIDNNLSLADKLAIKQQYQYYYNELCVEGARKDNIKYALGIVAIGIILILIQLFITPAFLHIFISTEEIKSNDYRVSNISSAINSVITVIIIPFYFAIIPLGGHDNSKYI